MAHVTHTTSFMVGEQEYTHTSEALSYWVEGDGCVVVEAQCCGDPATKSRHSFYDIGRDTADGPIDAEAEITAHVQRVSEHHAAVHKAKLTQLDGMVRDGEKR